MKVTARSTPNIALIKYWGNRNDVLRLPAADSLSMTLNTPSVDITIEHADILAVTSKNKEMTEKDVARFAKHIELMKQYLHLLRREELLPASLSIQIDSAIPPAIGLASSAAVFSALAKAVGDDLSDSQISVLARLGSGSASRSIYGGFVAMENRTDRIDGATARQIAPEDHWKLFDIIVVPSVDEKKVGSTEGHAAAHTSPFFEARVREVKRRQEECIDAILKKDFEKLQRVSEEDALDMHHVMETQNPSLRYLTEDTHHIIAQVKELREQEHLPVLFTMDAGPTVHLICEHNVKQAILSFAEAQKSCQVFQAKVGQGAHIV